ncbi:MFS transporter [Globicatella sanguinis]
MTVLTIVLINSALDITSNLIIYFFKYDISGENWKASYTSSVDYGELKTGHRDESVIFSMQTFVVKAASGLAVFLTGIGLDLIGLEGNSGETGELIQQRTSTLNGLRLMMTILPMIGLLIAYQVFVRKFNLTDEKALEMSQILQGQKANKV